MDLQKLLKYQEIDKKIYDCEIKLKQSKPAQEYAKAMSLYKTKTDEMVKSVRDADDIAITVERYKQTYKKILEKMNDLNDVFESFEELKEIDKYEKEIAQSQKDLLNIERELTRLAKKMDECIETSKSALEYLKKLEELLKVKRGEMQQIKTAIEVDAKQYMAELKKLQAEIPANVIAKYTEIRKNKRMPVLVPCSDNFKSCQGCGMDIASDLTIRLQGKQIVECPNCGRLIYNNK